jgi:hypothetical protein
LVCGVVGSIFSIEMDWANHGPPFACHWTIFNEIKSLIPNNWLWTWDCIVTCHASFLLEYTCYTYSKSHNHHHQHQSIFSGVKGITRLAWYDTPGE